MPRVTTITAARAARRFSFAALTLLASSLGAVEHSPAQSAAPAFTPRDESPEDYAPGAGRDDTFYACTACHGFKLVAQQGMNRRQWYDTINWMTEKHRMPPLEGGERETVLNYLEAAYPPRTAPRIPAIVGFESVCDALKGAAAKGGRTLTDGDKDVMADCIVAKMRRTRSDFLRPMM